MPNPNFTDITIVLDRSGSMEVIADDTVGGFNQFLEDQKKIPGKALLTLVQFDHEYEFVHRALPIGSVPRLTRKTYVPRGSTALLDAIGRAINETGQRLSAQPEPERPGIVVLVILTDGLENASREFRRDAIFEMITRQRETYSWQFVFLGANQDAIQAGAQMGIPAAQAMTYAATADGAPAAWRATSKNIGRRRQEADYDLAFSEEQRDEQKKHGA
jgi:hypothetical protein